MLEATDREQGMLDCLQVKVTMGAGVVRHQTDWMSVLRQNGIISTTDSIDVDTVASMRAEVFFVDSRGVCQEKGAQKTVGQYAGGEEYSCANRAMRRAVKLVPCHRRICSSFQAGMEWIFLRGELGVCIECGSLF